MTHEQIEAAIERLRELSEKCNIYTSTQVINAVTDGPWVDDLIDLLQQADPDTHINLPVDADGEVIRIGDKVVCESDGTDATVMTVTSLETCAVCEGIVFADNGVDVVDVVKRSCYTYHLRHYHRPTVEDLLVDYYKECQLHASELGFVTDEDKERAWRDIATTFADKLREAMADDDAR